MIVIEFRSDEYCWYNEVMRSFQIECLIYLFSTRVDVDELNFGKNEKFQKLPRHELALVAREVNSHC